MSFAFQILPPLTLGLLGLAWLGPALWMYRDAALRLTGARRPAQALAAGVVLPVLAPLAWALLRTPETLEERHERELTRRHLERLLEPEERCLVCRTPVDERFVCCPSCATALRSRCGSCSEPIEFAWNVCPHCGQPAGEPARVIPLSA